MRTGRLAFVTLAVPVTTPLEILGGWAVYLAGAAEFACIGPGLPSPFLSPAADGEAAPDGARSTVSTVANATAAMPSRANLIAKPPGLVGPNLQHLQVGTRRRGPATVQLDRPCTRYVPRAMDVISITYRQFLCDRHKSLLKLSSRSSDLEAGQLGG